jgi:hypothetical protein
MNRRKFVSGIYKLYTMTTKIKQTIIIALTMLFLAGCINESKKREIWFEHSE